MDKLDLEMCKNDKNEYDRKIRSLDYKIVETSVEMYNFRNRNFRFFQDNDMARQLKHKIEQYEAEKQELTQEFWKNLIVVKNKLQQIIDDKLQRFPMQKTKLYFARLEVNKITSVYFDADKLIDLAYLFDDSIFEKNELELEKNEIESNEIKENNLKEVRKPKEEKVTYNDIKDDKIIEHDKPKINNLDNNKTEINTLKDINPIESKVEESKETEKVELVEDTKVDEKTNETEVVKIPKESVLIPVKEQKQISIIPQSVEKETQIAVVPQAIEEKEQEEEIPQTIEEEKQEEEIPQTIEEEQEEEIPQTIEEEEQEKEIPQTIEEEKQEEKIPQVVEEKQKEEVVPQETSNVPQKATITIEKPFEKDFDPTSSKDEKSFKEEFKHIQPVKQFDIEEQRIVDFENLLNLIDKNSRDYRTEIEKALSRFIINYKIVKNTQYLQNDFDNITNNYLDILKTLIAKFKKDESIEALQERVKDQELETENIEKELITSNAEISEMQRKMQELSKVYFVGGYVRKIQHQIAKIQGEQEKEGQDSNSISNISKAATVDTENDVFKKIKDLAYDKRMNHIIEVSKWTKNVEEKLKVFRLEESDFQFIIYLIRQTENICNMNYEQVANVIIHLCDINMKLEIVEKDENIKSKKLQNEASTAKILKDGIENIKKKYSKVPFIGRKVSSILSAKMLNE